MPVWKPILPVLDDTAGCRWSSSKESTTSTPPPRCVRLEEALERGGGDVVDLTASNFVDSSVLGALLDTPSRAWRQARVSSCARRDHGAGV